MLTTGQTHEKPHRAESRRGGVVCGVLLSAFLLAVPIQLNAQHVERGGWGGTSLPKLLDAPRAGIAAMGGKVCAAPTELLESGCEAGAVVHNLPAISEDDGDTVRRLGMVAGDAPGSEEVRVDDAARSALGDAASVFIGSRVLNNPLAPRARMNQPISLFLMVVVHPFPIHGFGKCDFVFHGGGEFDLDHLFAFVELHVFLAGRLRRVSGFKARFLGSFLGGFFDVPCFKLFSVHEKLPLCSSRKIGINFDEFIWHGDAVGTIRGEASIVAGGDVDFGHLVCSVGLAFVAQLRSIYTVSVYAQEKSTLFLCSTKSRSFSPLNAESIRAANNL